MTDYEINLKVPRKIRKDASCWVTLYCPQCSVPFQVRSSDLDRRKFCSIRCRGVAFRKYPQIEFQGVVYRLWKDGYYVSGKPRRRYHKVLWESVHGSVPIGYVVHHKDGNPLNNDLSNLELMEWGKHTTHHKKGVPSTKERPRKQCTEPGCGLPHRSKGLCSKHYQRLKMREIGYWR